MIVDARLSNQMHIQMDRLLEKDVYEPLPSGDTYLTAEDVSYILSDKWPIRNQDGSLNLYAAMRLARHPLTPTVWVLGILADPESVGASEETSHYVAMHLADHQPLNPAYAATIASLRPAADRRLVVNPTVSVEVLETVVTRLVGREICEVWELDLDPWPALALTNPAMPEHLFRRFLSFLEAEAAAGKEEALFSLAAFARRDARASLLSPETRSALVLSAVTR